MAQKTKSKSYTLLFSIVVFILTALGLEFIYYKFVDPPFWFGFAYIFAWVLLLALAYDFFVGGSRLSWKKLFLLIFGVTIISNAVTHSFFTVISPSWSFSATTEKNTYRLGEEVKIIVSLKNLGFVTHSFKSRVIEPVFVTIEYEYKDHTTPVWCSSVHEFITEFSIKPNQSLERNFVWNQTKSVNIEFGEEIEPGGYYIKAFIPSADSTMPITVDNLFWAWTSINITST